MEDADRAARLSLIKSFCARHPDAVFFDEPGRTLMDVFSAKALPLELEKLATVEERTNPQTGRPYLVLQREDGTQLALAEVGIAFAPDTRNTGPVADLPDVVCLRDYRTILDRLRHELYGHPDREPSRGTLQLLLMCIAILDGARAQGLDVGREESELEHHLVELEKRAPRPPTIP
ncbi:MAG TPA: hypothetical protein VKE49_13770 [Myxococcaceae bacterium]|nr:hypothetical protein [Myxococcaceae bacterium]